MKNTLKKMRLAVAVAALAVTAVSVSKATPVITISDGTSTYIIVDNGAATPAGAPALGPNGMVLADQDASAGSVTLNGVNLFGGAITLTLNTGQTKPFLGSAGSPAMYFNSQITTSMATSGAASAVGKTYTVSFIETGFTPTVGVGTTSYSGSVRNGTVGYSTYLNSNNSNYGTTTQLTSQSYSNNGVLSASNFSLADLHPGVNSATTYSLAQVLTFNVTTAGSSLQGSGTFSVPDNGLTLSLLGLGLISIEVVRRKLSGAATI